MSLGPSGLPFSLWLKEDLQSIGLGELKANYFPLLKRMPYAKSQSLTAVSQARKSADVETCSNLYVNWSLKYPQKKNIIKVNPISKYLHLINCHVSYILAKRVSPNIVRSKTGNIVRLLEFHLLHWYWQVLSKCHGIYSSLDFVGGEPWGQSTGNV